MFRQFAWKIEIFREIAWENWNFYLEKSIFFPDPRPQISNQIDSAASSFQKWFSKLYYIRFNIQFDIPQNDYKYSMNRWQQVISEVNISRTAATQGAHHVIHLIFAMAGIWTLDLLPGSLAVNRYRPPRPRALARYVAKTPKHHLSSNIIEHKV